MSKLKKISFRKIFQVLFTLVVTSGCIVAILGASKIQTGRAINDISLQVRNEHRYQFLDRQSLWNDLVVSRNLKAGKSRLGHLDVRSLESAALENPWVSEAQAFVDNRRNLNIRVTQCVPVARIFFEDGHSAYLDASLNLLPLADQFTYYTILVTNVPNERDSSQIGLYSSIVKLVKFIEKDTFWSAQVAQLIVTEDLGFELVPVLGNHKILFGDTTRTSEKFRNLFAFYKNVLNRIGWDKYETLDLRFSNQIVAAPTLPWKSPSKNAISNMDWLQNIMEQAPQRPLGTVIPKQTIIPQVQASSQVSPPNVIVKPKTIGRDVKKESQRNQPPADEPIGKYIYQGNNNH